MCPKTSEEKEKISIVPYANVVGSLMYTMICTRPDICYVIGLVSRYQSNPVKNSEWQSKGSYKGLQ